MILSNSAVSGAYLLSDPDLRPMDMKVRIGHHNSGAL
jgi:hypothetical protein